MGSRLQHWRGAVIGVHAWKKGGATLSPDMDVQAGGLLGLPDFPYGEENTNL